MFVSWDGSICMIICRTKIYVLKGTQLAGILSLSNAFLKF